MKTISLKFTFLIVGISILSGCYTQLSEPISREEYYTEPDTVYQYQENELSEYNLGYRDGFRDFTNDYLWYGYNPNSYFYSSHRPYWSSPWSYHHSFYLGVYDPFFYDPFWDWGYAGYYSPYSYYGYNSWYNSRHYYSHGYYYHRPHYYHSGYANTKKVSEGREQLTANRQPTVGTASTSQASRIPVSNNSDFQNTLNLPMAAGSGKSSTASGGSQPNTQRLPEDIIKPNINSKEVKTLDVRPTKSPDEDLPGFQTTLIPPAKLETKPIKSRSTSGASPKRTITVPVKKSSAPSKTSAPSKSPSSSSSEETKTISTPKSDSGSSSSSSSKSSYSAPANSSSSNSSSGSSSGSRSSSSSSSRSGSSKSSSSESSSKSSSKKSN